MVSTTVYNSLEDFKKIFYEIDHNCELHLANNNEVRFYMLDIQNYQYSYYQMFELLKRNMGRYALSRKQFNANVEYAISKAISRFHEVINAGNGAGGELGEILLYVFLETVLGAPKLLSKMELKGTRNQYNYNSDAVHFFSYRADNGCHNQVILCESKLQGNVSTAIDNAFQSLHNSLQKRFYDFSLVSTEIFKETMSEDDAAEVLRQIIPNITEDINYNIIKETAVGIFIGFDFPVVSKGDSIATRNETIRKIKDKIPFIVKKINEKINEYKMQGMSFYIYLLPFNDIDKDRKEIMDQLLINATFEG